MQCCVRVNGLLSWWFPVGTGLKQGCLLSQVLFNLYTSDIAETLKTAGAGIQLGSVFVHALFYADDLCIIAETERDLQTMLSALADWYYQWKLIINTNKTKVVHFRPPSIPRTHSQFFLNNDSLETVAKYRYLGLVITEHLDLNVTAQTAAQSATRAPGILISKFMTHGRMPWITYTKLYHALVQPVLEYGAAVWAYKDCASIKAVQHRACRFFLGVGRYAPSSGVIGDMGWHPVCGPLWINVIREWCRLRSMKVSRLNRQVFDFTTRPRTNLKVFPIMCKVFVKRLD